MLITLCLYSITLTQEAYLLSMGSHRVRHYWSNLAAGAAGGLKIYHLVGEKSNSYHTNKYTHNDIIKNIICDFKNWQEFAHPKCLLIFSRVSLMSRKSFQKCWPCSKLSKASFRKCLKSQVWINSACHNNTLQMEWLKPCLSSEAFVSSGVL